MNSLKTKVVPSALALVGLLAVSTANAALIDFTSPAWTKGLDGIRTAKGLDVASLGRVTLRAQGGDGGLTSNTPAGFSATPPKGGIGIGGDGEISGKEKLNVRFAQDVKVAGLNFQGLLKKNERIVVRFFKDGVLVARKIISGSGENGGQVGVNFDGILADRLVFNMGAGSVKANPKGGASLAGISVVPIPAAAWLFGSALLGLGGVAYRRNPKGTVKA